VTEDLERLAELIRVKNEADRAIAQLIGRPALPGNIGEFVAARIFRIELMAAGNQLSSNSTLWNPERVLGGWPPAVR
jgi:hypothetical protein